VSVDGTPGTVLTRLEGAGYGVMFITAKGEGWIFTIVAHGWPLFLSEKYQIFYIVNEYKKFGLVDDVIQGCSLPFELTQSD
jgi:hypothetical protein